jgi:hypothetical protein
MQEVRRDDGELCGYVEQRGEQWQALTVFGAQLGVTCDSDAARNLVLTRGLASLAKRWELRARCEDTWQTVCIQEAGTHRITLALGYYSLPGVPTREIAIEDIRSGEYELRQMDS